MPLPDKGAGADYRLPFSLATSAGKGGLTIVPGDPSWDIWVGNLPFLLAASEERKYVRETVPIRRDRIDQAREPGESSLDSNLWLRSQTSWHNGMGQVVAEPLEESAEVARFKFHDSHGIDPWTAGELNLLPAMAEHTAGGGSATDGTLRCCTSTNIGVMTAGTTGVKLHTSSDSSPVTYGASTGATLITASDDYWMAYASPNIVYGRLDTPGESSMTAVTGGTALAWCKDRLWFGAGAALYEVTTLGTFPAAFHTFRSGSILDIASGAGGVYVMVRVGQTTIIYVITAQDNGTLNPPREVAQLPAGERGVFMTSYLGSYVIIGTTKGVRVADCTGGSGNELVVGPLTIEDDSGTIVDAVGLGRFVYTTGQSFDGAVWHIGMYRIDLSRQLSGSPAAPGRYAYARDMWSPVPGSAYSLAVWDDQVWGVFGPTSGTASLVYPTSSPVTSAWITSGQVTYSTSERKAWLSMVADIDGTGSVTVEVDSGWGFHAVTQSAVALPFDGNVDIDATAHPASGSLEWRLTLTGSPVVASVGLRATPSPRRTRYYRIPLSCFDSETDRNSVPVGYDGFAYDRLAALEALEQAGGLLTVTDTRTGEVIRAQVERITFESVTPPSRIAENVGGFVTLTLMSV